MSQNIRRSVIKDAEQFIEIKNQLPMPAGDESTRNGGFLLGTNIDQYRDFIRHCYCLSAEVNGRVAGFGVILPNEVLKQTEIWNKRHSASWFTDLRTLEQSNACYFEQLAFLKGYRKLAIALSYNLAAYAFRKGHTTLLTTTVNRPVLNLAAVPFIKAVNGKKVGNIDEVYPEVGNINSDIYMVKAEEFYLKVKSRSFYSYLKDTEITLE